MWQYYNPNPMENLRSGDCVIRAITKLTGKNWHTVYTELSVYGYALGDWGNSNAVWDAYLRDHGYKRAIVPNSCPNCFTVMDFCEEFATGEYLLGTGRHAVTVSNGNYYDSWDSGREMPIYYYYKEG